MSIFFVGNINKIGYNINYERQNQRKIKKFDDETWRVCYERS